MHEDRNTISNANLSKIFKCDHKAAQLLSKLYGYGRAESRREPKKETNTIQAEPKQLSQPRWNNVNNKVSNQDPNLSRFNKAKANAVSIPRFHSMKSENTSSMLRVDLVPHRKTIQACYKSIKENQLHCENYRPPPDSSFRCMSYEDEKCRLREIFAVNGGHTLPIMPMIQYNKNTDKNVISDRERQNIRLSRINGISHVAEVGMVAQSSIDKRKSADTLTLRDQIILEIKDREEFYRRHDGDVCDNLKRRLDEEIRNRMKELCRLDPPIDESKNF